MDRAADTRSLGDLLSELSQETATLVRQEVALARAELTRHVARMQRHAVLIVAGGVIAYAGILAVVAALVLVLIRLGLTPWLAALVAGVSGLKRDPITLEQTVDTLKENAQWAKNQVR
jgi:type IV secretory pathway TrbD component